MKIVALDLETTGLDNKKDKIIEIALVKFDSETFEIIESFWTLINPLIPIPPINSNITNIFDEDVKDAPIFNTEIIKKVSDFIWNCPILWHNTYFDRDFLINNWVNLEENTVLDTFTLANIIFFEEKSLNLWSLCEKFKIDLTSAHRAMDDTLATVKIFEKLKSSFKDLNQEKKELINFIFTKSTHKSFKKYLEIFDIESKILPEEEFIKIIKKIVKKITPEKIKKISNKNVSFWFKEAFNSFSNFEVRENQLLMSENVDDSLKNNKKVVIEAPTWVWKTFAYLVPAIIYSLKNDEQVFISTNTKTLQDQIYYKDLEFLKNNLNLEFNYTKLKWRRNYFSISQFLEFFLSFDVLELHETSFFSKIILWLYKTEFWELDELNYYPKEFILLKNIHADHFIVLREDNPYKYYEYAFKARYLWQNSNIVVINHSILLQDIKNKSPIFWEIKNLIVDEAHNLEDTTTDALKKSFSLENLQESFSKIRSILSKHNKIIDNLDNKISNIINSVSLIFDLFGSYAIKKNSNGGHNFDTLIEKDFFSNELNVIELKNNLEITFIEILNSFSILEDKIYTALKTESSNIEEYLEIIKVCLDEKSSEHYIPVFSYNETYSNTLSFMVLNPWKFLQNNLWEKIDSVVLTSATLKVNSDFNYISNILHLKNDFEFVALESDFDYSKQSLLFIPNDLWSVKYLNNLINNFILEFLKIVKWNTLILLTSFSSIKDLYLFANIELKKIWTTVLSQSISWSKHKIISDFKSNPSSKVILWTDSFWEGVDIPWDDLKYLIIYKFPFLVPTDPIFKARSKLFSDSFREYSIPKAIIKTKQGFWRLIRTKNDKWIVILLDDRFSNTNWWYLMKNAFPEKINLKVWNSKDFLNLIKNK
jgi:predicted DnaQ family exonuclease/DinG family helicase